MTIFAAETALPEIILPFFLLLFLWNDLVVDGVSSVITSPIFDLQFQRPFFSDDTFIVFPTSQHVSQGFLIASVTDLILFVFLNVARVHHEFRSESLFVDD